MGLLPREAEVLVRRLKLQAVEITVPGGEVSRLDNIFYPDRPSIPVGLIRLPRSTLVAVNLQDLADICFECNRAILGYFCCPE